MAMTFRIVDSHSSPWTKTCAEKRLPSTDSVVTLLKWIERHMSTRNIQQPGFRWQTFNAEFFCNKSISINHIVFWLKWVCCYTKTQYFYSLSEGTVLQIINQYKELSINHLRYVWPFCNNNTYRFMSTLWLKWVFWALNITNHQSKAVFKIITNIILVIQKKY